MIDAKEEIKKVMGADDSEAIEWVKNNEDIDLHVAWKVLEEYFNQCQGKLLGLDTSGEPFFTYSKDKVYRNVAALKGKDYFIKKMLESFHNNNILLDGAEITEESFFKLVDNKSNNSREEDWIISKANRLYNMYLKLGHSARITYLANYSLNNIVNRDISIKDTEQYELFHRTVLLSALLHDVGRFYQSIKYDGFEDGYMIQNEGSIEGENLDHAVAGYYYSLATALVFHKKGTRAEEKQHLIAEAIAAVVVKCHQKSNSKMPYFDYEGSAKELYDLDYDELFNFIVDAYNSSKEMPLTFDPEHQKNIIELVDRLERLVVDKQLTGSNSEGFLFNQEFVFSIYEGLRTSIEEVLLNNLQNPDKAIEEIVGILNKTIKELSTTEDTVTIDEVKKLFDEMPNYDVARRIEEMFKEDEKTNNIAGAIKYFISSALTITTDVDKIDILNQRSNGTYPNEESYKIKNVYIFPTIDNRPAQNSGSFLEIINNYFGFDYDLDSIEHGFIIDSRVLRILNTCHPVVKGILQEEFGDINIFNDKVLENDDVALFIRKDGITELRKDGNDEYVIASEKHPNTKAFEVLTGDWINYFVTDSRWQERINKDKAEDKKIRVNEESSLFEIKNKCNGLLRFGIPKEDLINNLSDYNEQERLDHISNLFFSDGLNERFMKEQNNPNGVEWIALSDNSDHITNNPTHAILWHMNQFIMVNARSRDTLEFVKESNMLDNIKNQLQDDLMQQLCAGYIDYCKFFIDYVLEDSKKQGISTFSGKYMADKRKEASEQYSISRPSLETTKTN